MTTINLNQFTIKNNDGSINDKLSAGKFLITLHNHVLECEEAAKTTENVVNSLFDEYKNIKFNLKQIIFFCLMRLNINPSVPELYSVFSTRIRNYIKTNSGDKNSGSIFNKNWKSKGIFRWKDHPDW